MNKSKKIILTLLFVAITPFLFSQQMNVKVITKKIERTFNYKEGYEVNIEGERAEVFIESGDSKEINVIIELISKHPDQKIAEADLETLKYLTQKVKNKIYLRNYIKEKKGEKTRSTLSARYTIVLPENCPVYAKTYFGKVNINNLSNKVKVNSEFSQIGLDNIKGLIELRTRFGDVIGQRLDGNVDINARRADISLKEIIGQFNIQAYYGQINVYADNGLVDLNIKGEKTDVYLFNPNLQSFSYALAAQHGEIQFPSNLNYKVLQSSQEVKKLEYRPKEEFYPGVTISVSFGNIHIDKTPSSEFR